MGKIFKMLRWKYSKCSDEIKIRVNFVDILLVFVWNNKASFITGSKKSTFLDEILFISVGFTGTLYFDAVSETTYLLYSNLEKYDISLFIC